MSCVKRSKGKPCDCSCHWLRTRAARWLQ